MRVGWVVVGLLLVASCGDDVPSSEDGEGASGGMPNGGQAGAAGLGGAAGPTAATGNGGTDDAGAGSGATGNEGGETGDGGDGGDGDQGGEAGTSGATSGQGGLAGSGAGSGGGPAGAGGSFAGGGAGGAQAGVCAGTPRSCSLLSHECPKAGGCSVERECTGFPATCSDRVPEERCLSQSGCRWDELRGCSGTPRDCDEATTGDDCITIESCTWAYDCTGTAMLCASHVTAAACLSQPGCTWQSGAGGQAGMGGSSGGQAGSANLLFFDDFEDGVADGWVEGGSSARDWHVLAGIYVQSRPYNAHSIAGNPAWTDQVVEVDVIRRDMGTLGIFVRYQAMDTHYRLLAGGNGALNLTREVAGVTTSLARAGVGFPDRFRLKCSAIGTTLRAYVDDVPYLTVSDSAVSSGSIGVMTTSEGSFDNVRVTSQ